MRAHSSWVPVVFDLIMFASSRTAQSYIVKHIFSASKPPVNLRKVAIGNGFLGSYATVRHLPVVHHFVLDLETRF